MYPPFPLFSICTFFSPPLYLYLPFPTPLSVPSSLSSFVPSFLRFFIYYFLSMLDIFFLAEDQENILLLRIDTYLPKYTTSYAGKRQY